MTDVLNSLVADASLESEKSYDVTILVSTGLTAIVLIIAVYALTVSAGIDPQELASMVVYP